MSERRVLILLLIFHIIIFSLLGVGVNAQNNIIDEKGKNSYVFISSTTSRTEGLSLSAVEGGNISILFPYVRFEIIAKPNTTYSIQVGDSTIAQGIMNSSHIVITHDFKEIQGKMTVRVGSDIHDFGIVIIKEQLSAKDIGEEPGHYLHVSPEEYSWVQWKAALGAFTASLISLPLAYLITKFYLERRGEYAT